MKSAAATVAEIEELVKEILIRVPTKPLLKFKCVSKQWLSLISDPYFCASHSRFQQSSNLTTTALFTEQLSSQIPKFWVIPLKSSPFTASGEFVMEDYFNVPVAKILQSCNGLLLCGRFVHPCEDTNDPGYFYFICNPTTRQFKKLSFPSAIKEKLRVHETLLSGTALFGVCLVFEPTISQHYKNLAPSIVIIEHIVRVQCIGSDMMKGHLHCIAHKLGYPKLEYDVVEIASDYSGWSVRYHVNLQSTKKTYRYREISFLSIIRDKNAKEWTLVISEDNSPMAYNLFDGTHKRLYDSESKLSNGTYKVYPYVESLVCV